LNNEVRTEGAPAPVGPYSQAVEAGAVYCAGQIGLDPSTGNLEDGIVAQTRRVLRNLEAVLEASGLGMRNVVKANVFMVDLAEFSQVNEEYSKHFSAPFPARTTVQVTALPKGARVEIDLVAVR
jgi:2-iminobutanoate/2-iminopropanoate deaminase